MLSETDENVENAEGDNISDIYEDADEDESKSIDKDSIRLIFQGYLSKEKNDVRVVIENCDKSSGKKLKPVAAKLRTIPGDNNKNDRPIKMKGQIICRKKDLENLRYYYITSTKGKKIIKMTTKETFLSKEIMTQARLIEVDPSDPILREKEFYRLDGMVFFGEKDGLFKMFKDFIWSSKDDPMKNLATTGKTVLKDCFQSALSSHYTPSHCLNFVTYIKMGGHKWHFLQKHGKKYEIDYNEYNKVIQHGIVGSTITSIKSFCTVLTKPEAEAEENRQKALTLIMILEIFERPIEVEKGNILFQALALQRSTSTMSKSKSLLSKLREETNEAKRKILDILLSFCKHHIDQKQGTSKLSTDWMNILPYVHILTNTDSSNFDFDPARVTTSSWWKADHIEEIYRQYLEEGNHCDMRTVLRRLEPFETHDKWIPRTLTKLGGIEKLQSILDHNLITLDTSCGLVLYTLKSVENRDENINQRIYACLRQIGAEFEERPRERVQSHELKAATVLLQCIQDTIEKTSPADDHNRGIILYCRFRAQIRIVESPWRDQIIHQPPDEIIEMIVSWLNSLEPSDKMTKTWNQFRCLHTIKDPFSEKWEDVIKEGFERIMNEIPYEVLIQIYMVDIQNVSDDLIKIMKSVTRKTLEEMYKSGKDVHIPLSTKNDSVIEVSSEILNEEWQFLSTADDDYILLHGLLQNQTFINVQRARGKVNKMTLSKECKRTIKRGEELFTKACKNLSSGNISLKTLRMLLDSKGKVLEIVEKGSQEWTHLEIKKVLELREKEHETLKQHIAKLQDIERLCKRIQNVDLEMLSKKIQEVTSRESDNLLVSDFCNISSKMENITVDVYQPSVKYFQDVLSEESIAKLQGLKTSMDSVTFNKIVDRIAHKLQENMGSNKKLSVESVIRNIWVVAKDELGCLKDRVYSASWTVSDAQKYFDKMDIEKVRAELKKMVDTSSTQWMTARISELEKYRLLKNASAVALVLLKLQKTYGLEGDFRDLETITKSMNNPETKIKDINLSAVNRSRELQEIDEEKLKCLETFDSSAPLVKWIQKEFTNGLEDLKTFVDLALISAGEGDIKIDKVLCLQTSVVVYAPLIFEQKKEKKSGTGLLLEKCQSVWDNLKNNPKAPAKLSDTRRDLEWFQSVKRAHGEVQVSALHEAEAINERGYFRIGNIGQKDIRQGGQLMLSDIIELSVPPGDKGKGKGTHSDKVKNYTFEELTELQSRMMLVAGRKSDTHVSGSTLSSSISRRKTEKDLAQESMNKFTMVFDNIIRLAETYTRLWSAGCILFKIWSADIFCSASSKIGIRVTFGAGKKKEVYEGNKDKGDIFHWISRLSSFMQHCLDLWMQYIKEKRDEFFPLNFYTMDQIVILQKELSNQDGKEPSNTLYPLLKLVNGICSKKDVDTAKRKVQTKIDEEKLKQKLQNVQDAETRSSGESQEEKEKRIFIEKLVKSGISKKLAMIALLHGGIKPTEPNKGKIWCMQNKGKESDLTLNSVGKRGKAEDISDLWVVRSDQGSTASETDELFEKMETLWNSFLSAVASSVSDFLSIEHVAKILEELFKGKPRLQRQHLNGFRRNEPNLIVCQKDQTFDCILSVYLQNESSLPKEDEILLCTLSTTEEQVDVFLRRALSKRHEVGKIYCLVNPEQMKFEIVEKADSLLTEYVKQAHGEEYRLVVICNEETEYRSSITSSLERYRVPAFIPIGKNDLLNRIKSQLKIKEESHSSTNSAAQIDIEQSTVRVVTSRRAGTGKSLFCKRYVAKMREKQGGSLGDNITIRLQHRKVDVNAFIDKLLKHTMPPGEEHPRIIHIDISYDVMEGANVLLFNLLILGCLVNERGFVWRKNACDLYLVETMPFQKSTSVEYRDEYEIIKLLPRISCRSPREALFAFKDTSALDEYTDHDSLFDEKEFRSKSYQRVLRHLGAPEETRNDKTQALEILIRNCGLKDPTWAEVANFIRFFDTQLQDFENSIFLNVISEGFPEFVLRFLTQMSKDFATRSMEIDHREDEDRSDLPADEAEISDYQIRRRWESSCHPYLFFNPDGNSMTFLGFMIDDHGNLLHDRNGTILEGGHKIIDTETELMDTLSLNGVNLKEIFDSLPRKEKLKKLGMVMGNPNVRDPDPTYELTTDNVKKILAIYMRFRCGIPVIVMGETGCGKTRLIKFMCDLQKPEVKEGEAQVQNMILMKVHGGSTEKDIVEKVKRAEQIAKNNQKLMEKRRRNSSETESWTFYTVLFLDEANTTEAIGLIKEIMCDHSVDGDPIEMSDSLKIVAACNPYRKQPKEFIEKLEKAGLGYKVDSEKTKDRMGKIPMRQLVYRVQPMPQSMLPLIWDFGHLDDEVENLYIKQMVKRNIDSKKLPSMQNLPDVLSDIFSASQAFMREQRDECKFVSLRDVERGMKILIWFHKMTQIHMEIEKKETQWSFPRTEEGRMTRSLVLSLGVCYISSLQRREEYCTYIQKYFKTPYILRESRQILNEMDRCQELFLDNVNLGENIARNQALKENIFMMVTCIEQRIPLFLVGKPGSSKSLTKTIVSDSMQEASSYTEFFTHFKKVQMISFQCSHLATSEGIVNTFKQAASIQKERGDLDKYVAVVVLDEVGLAEDSEKMPLKTLHPLLEEGFIDEEAEEIGNKQTAQYTQVGFIGISNWALDPAKMNRGILVQRPVPDDNELVKTAKGICESSRDVYHLVDNLVEPMAKAYIRLFEESSEIREFFGLRDFYCLVKMTYAFAERSSNSPTWKQIEHAVKRNFGGLEQIDPVIIFRECLNAVNIEETRDGDPDCTDAGLIRYCLQFENELTGCESRYLLLLTENYGALTILEHMMSLSRDDTRIVFGSSFPNDQELTTVCRNINKVKMYMSTGKKAVLLNLDNIYESLYDALNQYYVYLGGERYVDLGLGTTRVKCKVDPEFRLVVVADKKHVYERFPIPLINRLEKHILTVRTMLTEEQIKLADDLHKWASSFIIEKESLQNIFIGFNEDTPAALILQAWDRITEDKTRKEDRPRAVLNHAKSLLLWCCTPDAIIRYKNKRGITEKEKKKAIDEYFSDQDHDNLVGYLENSYLRKGRSKFVQVSTHAKLLTRDDLREIAKQLKLAEEKTALLPLKAFGTEQEFTNALREFTKNDGQLLVIQCGTEETDKNLIACARHCIQQEMQYNSDDKSIIIFLIHVPHVVSSTFKEFQTGFWQSIHLDEVRPWRRPTPNMIDFLQLSVLEMTEKAVNVLEKEKKDNSSDDEQRKGTLDMWQMIFYCLHKAVAMIPSRRAADSLNHMHDLLLNEGYEAQLTVAFSRNILSILHKKSEVAMWVFKKGWLSDTASNSVNISVAGTFRNSSLICLFDKITPILAEIIEFVDTNRNLELLKSNVPEWKKNMWLKLFKTPEVAKMSSRKRIHSADLVKESNDDSFEPKIPFSWVIFQQIEELLMAKGELMGGSDKVQGQDHVSICEIFAKAFEMELASQSGSIDQDLASDYTWDFVNLLNVTVTKKEEEKELIVKYINGKMRETDSSLSEPNAANVITRVHETYHTICEEKVQRFSKIVHVYPECISELFEESDETQSKTSLDIRALTILMKEVELDPDNDRWTENADIMQKEWVTRVSRFRPVIELMLEKTDTKEEQSAFAEHRSLWNKVVTLKMFIRNVVDSSSGSIHVADTATLLWGLMEDGGNLKNTDFIECIEGFLKQCNEWYYSHCKREFSVCEDCKAEISSGECIVLPCEHCICQRCFSVLQSRQAQGSGKDEKCKKCDTVVSKGYNHLDTTKKFDRQNFQHIKNFRGNCNAFYLNVVSKLCFADSEAPEETVIKKLLDYTVKIQSDTAKNMDMLRQRNFSGDEDCIELNQMVRFFLLQLLLNHCQGQAETFFDDRFGDMMYIEGQGSEEVESLKDLTQFIIETLEDSMLKEMMSDDRRDSPWQFHKLKGRITANAYEVSRLQAIALARSGLIYTAKLLHDIYVEKVKTRTEKVSLFLDSVKRMVISFNINSCQLRHFLAKEICRSYGIDSYHQIIKVAESSDLSWIIANLKIQEESIDCFAVLGKSYTYVFGKLKQHLVESKVQEFDVVVQKKDLSKSSETATLILAIQRAFMSQLIQKGSVSDDTKILIGQMLEKKLSSSQDTLLQSTVDIVVSNSLPKKIMLLNGEAAPLTMPQQTILCLVTHFVVAVAANRDIDLLKPFRDFLKDPMSLKGCYIPTMPEENLDAVMKAIHEMQKNNYGENITFYRCPNGHLYSIGDCGRPWVQAVCPHCGEKIGGTSHNLLGDNTKDLGENKTKPGYILGPASDRAKQAVPERKLSAAACELLRFMIHALFLWKTLDSPQEIDQLCSEDIGEDRVFHFFLEHVVKSFEILKHTLGKSPEDICIFLHNMCAQITKTERTQTSGDSTMSLKDLGSRAKWEEQMLQDLLNPALKRQDEYIKEGRKEVLSEYGASSDVLLTVIHEREENADELDINQENLHVHPVVWRYRTRVSLEHFANSFRIHIMEKDGNDKEFHILKSFMEMNEVLQYIRHVPDILKLQKLLMEQYFRKIDKDEAGQRTIQQHLEDCKTDGTKAVYETLIQKTTRVWDDLKRHLTNHLCRTESAFNQFPKEYTTITITNSTTLDMLLPSTRGLGICSYAMLEFLLMKQNEFLEKIYPEEMAKSEKVKVPSLVDIQLISYDPDVDILPTILANSTCSFKYREGTEINYEFMNFQSQIEDSIFSAKSLIDTRSIPVMTFRSEIRDVFVFKSMNQSQESLPQQAKRQISSEMNDLSDIYTSLSNIFIVARFLETLTCDPSMLLDEFMTEKLHFEVSLHSQKARQCCQIKHVKSLWISLSHDRAKRLTENGKNAFDELQKELREEMDKTDEQQIKDFFDKTSTEKLELLLEAIFEVILFRLPEYSEGEDRHVDVKGISLYELLEAHLEDSFFAETNESGKRLEWESVPNFPQTIQAGYAVEIWKLLFRTLSKSHGDN